MRTLTVLSLLFVTSACSRAQEKKDPEPARPSFNLGDAAPPLKASKWLQGEPVTAFAPGRVYVVDFWATWCGPCIESMPHLNDLAEEYGPRGLTAIALTTRDDTNTAEAVAGYVKKNGPKFGGLQFAFCDNDATFDAYMTASGQGGIPCSFVIDKAGKLAFIGNPLELDDVLPKVLDGTWRGQADIDAIATMNKEFVGVFEKAEKDGAAGLKALDEFAAKYPAKAAQPDAQLGRAALLLQNKRYDEAKAVTGPVLEKYKAKKHARGLNSVRAIWTSKELNADQKHLDVATAAAEAYLTASPPDPVAFILAAQTYAAAGNKEKAADLADRAVRGAEGNAKLKAELEKLAEEIKK